MNNLVFTHSTIKSHAKLAAAQNHNRREKSCPNANPEKTPLNRVLIGEEKANYLKTLNERYSGITIAKNTVISHDFVIAVDRLEQVLNPLFSTTEFCSKSVDWAKNCVGLENVVDMVYHADEHAPHVHLITTNLTTGGVLSAPDFLRERGGLSAMQTDLANRLAPLSLERGLEGGCVHRSNIKKDFYTEVNHAASLFLPAPRRYQSLEEYVREVNRVFESRKNEHLKDISKFTRKIMPEMNELRETDGYRLEDYLHSLNEYLKALANIRENKEVYAYYTSLQRAYNYGILKDEQIIDLSKLSNIETEEPENNAAIEEYYDYDELVR